MMLRAIHFPNLADFKGRKLPGSTHFDFVGPMCPGAEANLWVSCPGGTGELCRIEVSRNPVFATGPVLSWNGSMSDPTIHAPVALSSGWEGRLRLGCWGWV